jgi:threonine synthase
MKYYSTNKKAPSVSLREAIIKGLAPDGGLYMPEKIKLLVDDFFENMDKMFLPEIV